MSQLLHEVVYKFVDEIEETPNFADLNRRFRTLIEEWGFDGWGCVQVSSAPGEIKSPLLRIFGDPNLEWVRHYLDSNHIAHDTAAHESMRRKTPFFWDELLEGDDLTKRQQLVYDEATDFGLKRGLAVPVHFPDGSAWSVLMYGEKVDDHPHLKQMALLAGTYYAARGLNISDRMKRPIPLASRLTTRERQIVELLRLGEKNVAIAKLLGTSESTITKQVERAKERFGARTQAQLVAEALLSGDIGERPHVLDQTG